MNPDLEVSHKTTVTRDPGSRLWSQSATPPPPAPITPGQLTLSDDLAATAATAQCLRPDCHWTATGTPDHVDREARRHTGDGLAGGPGHATLTGRGRPS